MEDILPEEQEQHDLNAAATAQHEFLGKPLEPFSWGRFQAMQRLSKEGLSGFEFAVAIVYLCTLKPAQVVQIRGEGKIVRFLTDLESWAEANKVYPKTRNGEQLQAVCDRIWEDYQQSISEPELPKTGLEGASGKLSSAPSSSTSP